MGNKGGDTSEEPTTAQEAQWDAQGDIQPFPALVEAQEEEQHDVGVGWPYK